MNSEHQKWQRCFASQDYYYGTRPGPVAQRAVRYCRDMLPQGGTALDAGCGEGQDLAYLASEGFTATGLEWTAAGVEKTRRLLRESGQEAVVLQQDLSSWEASTTYDLVLCSNVLQFLGSAGPQCLRRLACAVAPQGILALSLFARDDCANPTLQGNLWLTHRLDLLEQFSTWQPLEAADLWQWSSAGQTPRAFVTLLIRRPANLTD